MATFKNQISNILRSAVRGLLYSQSLVVVNRLDFLLPAEGHDHRSPITDQRSLPLLQSFLFASLFLAPTHSTTLSFDDWDN